MRILITGGRGQLAADLVRAFEGHEVTALGRQELDITLLDQIRAAMDGLRPDVVLNTAAYHRVDLCESEPEQSFLVNAAAPQRLAATCRARGALLVHFTTDYVFGGRKRTPYEESDPVDPINVYGASKVAGELAIRATDERHLIVRTTGLYGHAAISNGRPNFVETMLRLAAEDKPISVVANQVLTPSFTRDVAETVVRLMAQDATGTVHVTNGGACSWYEFAAEIFRLAGMRARLSPTTQEERPMPARRPAYSVLGHEGLRRQGVPEPRPWQEALAAYFSSRP
jgi:dTDP-4-dehydrorhamnose reductase